MIKCKICEGTFPNNTIGSHLKRKHGITLVEYEKQFDYFKSCYICGLPGYRQKPLWYVNMCKKCIDNESKEILEKCKYNDIKNFRKYNDIYQYVSKKLKMDIYCKKCGKPTKIYKFKPLPLCTDCEKNNDYNIPFSSVYNNYKSKEKISNLPKIFKISYWENNSNFDKETIFKLVNYIKENRRFFLYVNFDNETFIKNLVNNIVKSDFELKLDRFFTTATFVQNEKGNFGYKDIQYFIDRGYSEYDCKKWNNKVSDNCMSLKRMQEKYGKTKGTEKWENFKLKSKQTKNNFIRRHGKSEGIKKWEDYILKISYTSSFDYYIDKWGYEKTIEKWKNRFSHLSKSPGYSKISQKLFWEIYKHIDDKDDLYFAEHNSEWFINKGKNLYFADFKYHNIIIEFYGDYWHKNPIKYNKTEEIEKIWQRDKIRIDDIEENGFYVLIIWEHDFIKNKGEIIKRCLDFIENNLNKGEIICEKK